MVDSPQVIGGLYLISFVEMAGNNSELRMKN